MNKEYIQSGDQFIINRDLGLKKVNRIHNLTEILETENNIEEIENLKKQNNKEQLFSYKNTLEYIDNKFYKKFFSITIPIVIIIALVTAIVSNINLAITTLLISFCGTGIVSILASIINIPKIRKTFKSICKSADELLTIELANQKEKIEELEKESKVLANNDLGIMGRTIKIEKSELIKDLKRKLILIQDYQLMKKSLMKFSEDSLLLSLKLECMSYSKSDIEFIHQLIENDKNKENEIHKNLIKK